MIYEKWDPSKVGIDMLSCYAYPYVVHCTFNIQQGYLGITSCL